MNFLKGLRPSPLSMYRGTNGCLGQTGCQLSIRCSRILRHKVVRLIPNCSAARD
jgi:hypothetical protein